MLYRLSQIKNNHVSRLSSVSQKKQKQPLNLVKLYYISVYFIDLIMHTQVTQLTTKQKTRLSYIQTSLLQEHTHTERQQTPSLHLLQGMGLDKLFRSIFHEIMRRAFMSFAQREKISQLVLPFWLGVTKNCNFYLISPTCVYAILLCRPLVVLEFLMVLS